MFFFDEENTTGDIFTIFYEKSGISEKSPLQLPMVQKSNYWEKIKIQFSAKILDKKGPHRGHLISVNMCMLAVSSDLLILLQGFLIWFFRDHIGSHLLPGLCQIAKAGF